MATTIGWKSGIDTLLWRSLNSPLLSSQANNNSGFEGCQDLRNDGSRDPFVYFTQSSASAGCIDQVAGGLYRYNPIHDQIDKLLVVATFPIATNNPTLRTTVFLIQQPSRGPRGTLAAGATTSAVVISTALPQSVVVNQLANRGDGVGYKIRIIGNHAGGSGLTEERYIIANTAGTAPTITVGNADGTANPFSFTPASGDAYEILSGRVYGICSSAANNRAYDIATGAISSPSTTNAPAASTDACGICLDELYVPASRAPGEGFLIGAATYNGAIFGCLTATATAAGTITGQASVGDAGVLSNEYRNFQIRIVEDTGTPTAVGQRRRITSHTAGPSPVYTLASNWTVTPSSTAKYVIEFANEIVVLTPASTNTYTYVSDGNGAMTADTWSTSNYGARGNAGGAGCNVSGMWGIAPVYDLPASPTAKTAHASFLIFFRGGATMTTDLLDIAGGSNGAWTNTLSLDRGRTNIATAQTLTTSSRLVYDPATLGGRYAHILVGQASDVSSLTQGMPTSAIWRYDLVSRQYLGLLGIPFQYANPSSASKLLWWSLFVDGTTKIGKLGVLGSPYATNNFVPPISNLCMELLV
jgi:hypothetical protein